MISALERAIDCSQRWQCFEFGKVDNGGLGISEHQREEATDATTTASGPTQ